MRLESGPASTDRNWHIARAVLFLGFALWFVYDGAVAWPAKNRTEAAVVLAAPQPFGGQVSWDRLSPEPTDETYDEVQKSGPAKREEVRARLGEPAFTSGSDEYYISRYGYGKITYTGNRPSSIGNWVTWYKTRADIQGQFYWAILPALPGLWFLWRAVKAMTLRVTIDDEGMVYDKQRIAFAAMTELRDYSPKGWIDLYYKVGEAEKKLRLDNQKVKRFDEIVDALCHAKGFRNEAKIHAEEQARRHADEQRAAAAEDAAHHDEQDPK